MAYSEPLYGYIPVSVIKVLKPVPNRKKNRTNGYQKYVLF